MATIWRDGGCCRLAGGAERMIFKNYMEDAVDSTLDEILELKDACKC
jgi:hypothetical protein